MLPARSRVRRSAEFGAVVRSGRRSGRSALVVHCLAGEAGPARAGVVVSKAIGNAVVRNRVRRRLQHQLAEVLPTLPAGTLLVVRALPASAGTSYDELGSQLRSATRKLTAPAPQAAP